MTRKTYVKPVAAPSAKAEGVVTQTELIWRVHKARPWIPLEEIRHAVDSIFGRIEDALVDGDIVALEHFGTFEPEWIPPRERWVASRRRTETYPGQMAIRFFQAYAWCDRPGFEHLTPFEKRLRDKKRRDTAAHLAKVKKKPRR